MSLTAPAVLLMPPPGPAEPVPGLTAFLDAQAERWARAVAGEDVQRVSGSLIDAVAQALSTGRDRTLLAIWPTMACWRPDHATGALGDLREGAALVVGPVIDGGLYLLGTTRPLGELVELPDGLWNGTGAVSGTLGAASRAGLEIGMLRAERGLRTRDDVDAALADPLTPPELASVLAG
jgi:uncharacterized protein